ncbi:MAG TPA: type II secretion system protein [Rhodocyclaceae bacterium]|nr:type II secretion system protein [Rhodocyclaceae bacterium]
MAGQKGFTYLGLLFAIALMGLLLASAGQVWKVAAQREREEELLFIGQQFSTALASYRAATPGESKQWPRRLEDLVEDRRGPLPLRHLRKVYFDPFTGDREWGLIKVGEGIAGVYSLAQGRPLKQANFPPGLGLGKADSYREWRFTAAGGAGEATQ